MKLATILLASVAIAGTLIQTVRADEWDKKTIITFSGPVEIPGRVLSPGTYVFKLADSSSDRHIVQVFDKDQKTLYGNILAIPDWRNHPADKTVITFEERAAGSPEAVKAWFYPGDNFGQMFVYPKTRAIQLAQANDHPVPSMPDTAVTQSAEAAPQPLTEPEVKRMTEIPLKAATPQAEEMEITEVFARTEVLPATGSTLPLFAAVGLACLAGACTLRLRSDY
ncbi:MAG: hypothetical protein H7Y20_12090 [Bryobacteraceae bacterium]|nr:hypothetical protein [Bryobacteraceae bacterium]